MQAQKDDQDEVFTRQASGKSIRLSIAASLSKTIAAKGEIVKIDPSSQKLLGAIKQAKKEQENGSFDTERQSSFLRFAANQRIGEADFPDSVWTDVFDLLQNVLLGIHIATMSKNITPDQTTTHVSIIRLLCDILSHDPRRIEHLSVGNDEEIEAFSISRLVSSSQPDTVNLGVNFCMMLVQHQERLTIQQNFQFQKG